MQHAAQRTAPLQEGDRAAIRLSLLDRRSRLQAVQRTGAAAVAGLLVAVDAALDRLEHGMLGACERCDGLVEPDRLMADPLATVCLDCLSAVERSALQRDLELASRVQATLLPPRDFAAGGWQGTYLYRPHGTVGGDYVDVLRPTGGGDGDLVVLLGDVSGKGIASAMLMSHLHAGMRALSEAGSPLAELLERANRLLHGASSANLYATLVAVRLGAGGGAEVVTAGHPPVLVVGAEGVRRIASPGLPVGLFADVGYTSTQVVVAPGEALVLYTDGVSECLDPAGVELGVDGIGAALAGHFGASPRQLVDVAIAAADAHRGHDAAHDDLTVAAIRYRAH